ncbi:amino acid permease [Sphingosinicella microcystinivorans]|uniref:amino acid permease n=1 Tax=Sphingosinicella microcystinivorans TaxID=335406 RepID=UPI0022F3F830|nr:amino acid permease [Sphingosinicella microcystinivorans]WBX83040.1 amino acid permease [Sphingosinicella microcystinivorans]
MQDRGSVARPLGFWMALALVMGNMIGSGVFMLPASLAPFGWNAVYGWVLTIAGSLCLAYVFASLAREMPHAGGPHGFVEAAFGHLPAFMISWSYIVSILVAVAALATAGVSYLSAFAPGIAATSGAPAALAVSLLWAIILLNLRGAGAAGRFQLLTLGLKLLPLVAIVVIAAMVFAEGTPPATPYAAETISMGAINATATLTLWAMLGFESACVPQDKVDRPHITIPRATMAGTLIVGVIYLVVCTAVIMLMPAATVAQSNAPFADVIAGYWGEGAALTVALFAVVSAIGALNGWILLAGEYPLTMARKGDFPRPFGVANARGTPVLGILISGVFITALVLSNYTRTMSGLFTFMALLSTSATLVLYFACAAAAIRLMLLRRLTTTPTLAVLTPLGLIYAVWTFHGAGAEANGWALVLLVAGLPVYLLVRRQKAMRGT